MAREEISLVLTTSPAVFKMGHGHCNQCERATLDRGYHQAELQRSQINSIQGNANIKVSVKERKHYELYLS